MFPTFALPARPPISQVWPRWQKPTCSPKPSLRQSRTWPWSRVTRIITRVFNASRAKRAKPHWKSSPSSKSIYMTQSSKTWKTTGWWAIGECGFVNLGLRVVERALKCTIAGIKSSSTLLTIRAVWSRSILSNRFLLTSASLTFASGSWSQAGHLLNCTFTTRPIVAFQKSSSRLTTWTSSFIWQIRPFKGYFVLINILIKVFSKTAVFEPLEKLRPGQSYLPPKVEATLIPDHQVWSTERLGSFIDEQLDQPNVYQNFIKREIHDVILDAAKRNSYHTRQVDGCFELYGADIGE